LDNSEFFRIFVAELILNDKNMELKELREKIASKSISSCFMVEHGNIYEFKIAFIEGKKDVSPIQTSPDGEKGFFVGFENPGDATIWHPNYAQPVIVVTGINEKNGKLSLATFSKGGYDVPNAWFTIRGDFFLSEHSAKEFINH
jgi:hypothetical protein